MKIAILGWGSLVWDPRSLHIRAGWFTDGPLLPVEFARESKDKRVTLVITPGSPVVRSLWALSSLESVEAATADLAFREEIKDENDPYSIGLWKQAPQAQAIVDPEIGQWATRLELDAVIWTRLKPRFGEQERIATADEVVTYLRGLSPEQQANAERYVRMTPRQIDTPYRRRLEQEFGWLPSELSERVRVEQPASADVGSP
jgi:hypothetical protein